MRTDLHHAAVERAYLSGPTLVECAERFRSNPDAILILRLILRGFPRKRRPTPPTPMPPPTATTPAPMPPLGFPFLNHRTMAEVMAAGDARPPKIEIFGPASQPCPPLGPKP